MYTGAPQQTNLPLTLIESIAHYNEVPGYPEINQLTTYTSHFRSLKYEI